MRSSCRPRLSSRLSPPVGLRWPVGLVVFFCCLSALCGGVSLRASTPGTVDPVFGGASLGLSGKTQVVAIQPDGRTLVGGRFVSGVVRLQTDGSVDTSFQSGLDTSGNLIVGALALQPDGKVLVGGEYNPFNTAIPPYLVRLNSDGSVDTSFYANPGTGNGSQVSALALQPDGKIIVATDLYTDNDTFQLAVVRLNADGSLDTGFQAGTGTGYQVTALTLQADGKIVVGGNFTQIGGVSQNGIARLNADGSLDGSFRPGLDYGAESVALQPDGKLVIGGGFTQVNGVSRVCLARLNADGSLDTGFNPPTASYQIFSALALQADGKIVVSTDYFATETQYVTGLTRFNADGSLDSGFQATTDVECLSIAAQSDGKVIIGGQFTQVNSTGTNSVVRLATDGQIDHSFNADVASGPNAPVATIALQPDGRMVIGGSFTQVGGASRIGIARLKADGSVDASFSVNIGAEDAISSFVDAVALQPDGKIVFGGYFTTVNGVSANCVARLNADGSLDTGFHAGNAANDIYALAVQPDGKILAAGPGTFPTSLARLNGDGSLDASFNANSVNTDSFGTNVLALQPDGRIIFGATPWYGTVVNYSDAQGGTFARFNTDGSLDASFHTGGGASASNIAGGTYAVALQPDGRVLIGGNFTGVDGVDESSVARLNADGTLDTGFQAALWYPSVVSTLAVQPDGKIVVGGNLTLVGGTSQIHLARLNADGSVDAFFNPGGSGPNGTVVDTVLQPDGKILIGGKFTSVGTRVLDYIARLNGGGAPDFFYGGVPLGSGFYYEQFPSGNAFGYYNVSGSGYSFPYFFHVDLGMEYFFDAQDGHSGAYLYDFASGGFFYTSPTFPWPYLYDFNLNTVLYYYPDPTNPGRYNTDGYRFFYRFDNGQIIVK